MDQSERLLQAVASARKNQRRLRVSGAGSKSHWLPGASGDLLSTLEHTGIVSYDPAELVVTVRSGTLLKDLELELGRSGQQLASDPPRFASSGTVGGAVSSGLSGPARPWRGALRDAVLGVELVNGLAERLRFGGQVMKNVAGYDVSRLATGAYGALGLILSVSLRVHPIGERESTLSFELDPAAALAWCRDLARMPLPLSGACWVEGRLHLRLSGSDVAVRAAQTKLGGQAHASLPLWAQLRDQQHVFFRHGALSQSRDGMRLWRVIVPPSTPLPDRPADRVLVDWAGGVRWLWSEDAVFVSEYAASAGGWAWAMGQPQPLPLAQVRLMRAIKKAFDPNGVFESPLPLNETDAH